jgi:hypothetical protein
VLNLDKEANNRKAIIIVPPQMSHGGIRVRPRDDLDVEEPITLRSWAEERLKDMGKSAKNVKLRPNGIGDAQLAGSEAISVLYEGQLGERTFVGYDTLRLTARRQVWSAARSPTTRSSMRFDPRGTKRWNR